MNSHRNMAARSGFTRNILLITFLALGSGFLVVVLRGKSTLPEDVNAVVAVLIALSMFAAGWLQRFISAPKGSSGNLEEHLSDHKNAGQETFELKQFYRQVLDNLPIQLAVIGADFRYRYVNPASISKKTQREWIIGKTDDDYFREHGFDPAFGRKRQAWYKKIISTKKSSSFEETLHTPSGETKHILRVATPVLNKNGDVVQIIGYGLDITERRQAEAELERSLSLLKSTLDSTADGILVVNKKGKIESFNQKFAQMWGIPNEILAAREDNMAISFVTDLLVAPEGFLRQVRKLYGKEEQESFDILRFKDGRVFERYSTPQRIGKRIVGRVWSFRDVTERHRSAEALQESKNMLQVVLDAIPVRVFWKDRDSAYLGCNQLFAEDAGLKSPDEIIGKNDFDLAWVEQAELYRKDDRDVMASGQSYLNYEEPQTRTDGTELWRRTSKVPLRDLDGNVVGILGCYEDNTARKQAEQALKESEEKFRLLSEAAFEGIGITDEGEVVDVNAQLAEMLGYQASDLVGRRGIDFVAPESRDMVAQRMQSGAEEPYEYLALKENGQKFPVEVRARHLPFNGRTLRVAAIRDITERKQFEERMRSLNDELERRVQERTSELQIVNRELEAFAYSVSHDLRAPLRGINGFSQALLEDYHDLLDEKGKNYLSRVRAASERMGQLIDNLLDLSRITRLQMRRQNVNLSTMAEEIAQETQEADRSRDVKFIIKPNMNTNGDPTMLRVALDNLFENAWKFTAKHPQATIEFGEKDLDGRRVFFVRDDGAGFDMKYMDKLFAPFQRLHNVTEYPGTGIGLATVQRIVHRHGGTVWAEAEVGKGATFYFSF